MKEIEVNNDPACCESGEWLLLCQVQEHGNLSKVRDKTYYQILTNLRLFKSHVQRTPIPMLRPNRLVANIWSY